MTGSVSEVATLTINDQAVTVAADRTFTRTLTVVEGPNTITLRATDPATNVGTETVQVTLDTVAPTAPPANQVTVGTPTNGQVTVSGGAGRVEGGARVTVTNSRSGASVTVTATADGSFSAQLAAQAGDSLSLVVSDGAGNDSGTTLLDVAGGLPPDPATVAPPINRTVATDLFTVTAFLYTGNTPIQTGVAAGTIEARRVAVLRGKVLTRDGAPLSGVNVSILNHPEFGRTRSRADGMFDMAVNGGGPLTLNYEKVGYLPAQRQVTTPWRDFVFAPEVALVPLDSQVTTIDLTDTAPMQVAQGSEVTDSDGTRQATLLFPQGTTAQMVMPDGSTQPLTTLHVRATEYTVGPNGPKAMPASLPPSSGYTYAVELSADEAIAADADSIEFTQPVVFYVNNFLNFPVGSIVPLGSYDRRQGMWIPEDNGKIIKILSISGGVAALDITGDGVADEGAALSALGITDAERVQLATLYTGGQSLWRMAVQHFSPYDPNWTFGAPPGATLPTGAKPSDAVTAFATGNRDFLTCDALIGSQSQTLNLAVPIVGTPFSFTYQSARTPSYRTPYSLKIPVSGDTVPPSTKRIELRVDIAGQRLTQSFAPTPRQDYTFTWDGKDGYGRLLEGSAPVSVSVGFVYPGYYANPAELAKSFGSPPVTTDIIRDRDNLEVRFENYWSGQLGAWDALPSQLGGWNLSAWHNYDDNGQMLWKGTGDHKKADTAAVGTVKSVPNTDNIDLYPTDVAIAPDGDMYLPKGGRLYRVTANGTHTPLAGNASMRVSGIALGRDESLYFSEPDQNRIRHLDTDGNLTTFAGNGQGQSNGDPVSGDGGPATAAKINRPNDVALGPDGALYIAEASSRIRRVGVDGVITTVAGISQEEWGYSGDGGPATQAKLTEPSGVAFDRAGNLYIADTYNHRIRKVSPSGIISTVAGTGSSTFSGDGGQATSAGLSFPVRVRVGPDDRLYISDSFGDYIRRVNSDGIISTIAGCTSCNTFEEGSNPRAFYFSAVYGFGIAPNGFLYLPNGATHLLHSISPSMPGYSQGDKLIPNTAGSVVYQFNAEGRHLNTLDALTGVSRFRFTYETAGRLTTVTDVNDNVTTLERNFNGDISAIVGPFGQRTEFTVNADGLLTDIRNPAGKVVSFQYTNGQLTDLIEPNGNHLRYTYDSDGLLVLDQNAMGGTASLAKTPLLNGHRVSVDMADLHFVRQFDQLPEGGWRIANTLSDLHTETTALPDDSFTQSHSSGTSAFLQRTPDSRFGMLAPVPALRTSTTPSGLTRQIENTRSIVLQDPADPLSVIAAEETPTITGRQFSIAYDAEARTITSTTPEGRIAWRFLDEKGRVIKVETPELAPLEITYDERGRVTEATRRSSTEGTRTATATYESGYLKTVTDPLGRTLAFAEAKEYRALIGGVPQFEVEYTRDALGRITQKQETLEGTVDIQDYTYDLAGRLTEVKLNDVVVATYTYDPNGNRLTSTTAGGETAYTYDAQDRLLTQAPVAGPPSVSYTYTANGELASHILGVPSPTPPQPPTHT